MNRHLYPQIRTIHVLSVIAVFAISAGILLAAQSGCIGATLAGTDGSYDTPDTGLSEHAPVQKVTAWDGMSNLIVACQIADTFADMLFTGVLDVAYAVHAVLSLTAVGNITDTVSLKLDGVNDITTFVPQLQYAFAQTPPADAFVTTWKTASADQSITLPMKGTYSILWGDGSNSPNVSDSQSHTYGAAGNYTVTVLGDGLLSINLSDDTANALQLRSIEQWGGTEWTTMNGAFSGARNMVYNATDTPDLSGVTDMSRMFRYTTAFNGDLSSWDVSAVTDMSGMFAFTSVFNQPLNDWDVSSVTGMSGMFAFTSVFNQPLNDWDVSSVTTMNSMFADATSFNQPLNAWNVSKVTDMSFMFGDATSFNGNLSSWDVSSVTTMSSMFRDATSFDQPLNAWDVSSVTNMFSMFRSASSFNQTISSWDVSSVTDMNDMFYYATSFNQPLNGWDVSKVTDMSFMFFGASSFNQTISSWDVSAVTDMSGMFAFTSVFNQPLNDWDVSSVTGMSSMFAFTSVFNQPLNDWDVSSVTDMNGMFHFASSFNQPLNDWDVSSVTNMADMFSFATSFDQNLGNWYVTLDPDTIAGTGIPGVVGTISAQNQPLKNHSPTYVIVDGLDKNHFEIVPGNQLNMTSGVPGKAEYSVNVTASGGSVFESGNNWRLLEIKVTGQITDTTPPVIKLEGSSLVTITVDETYTEQGATCEDDVDADKPATVGGDTVDTSTVGQYTVTYDCTDSSNNEATQVSRTVNVQSAPDTDAPVIIITGSANIQLTVDETYTEQGATCDDDVDADKPATVGGDTVDTSTVGQYTVTYDCTDTAGNVATQVLRTVNVQDAPDTTLLADAFITTWRTDSANQTITIPVGGSTARYSIDWGDNSPAETDITGDSTHTYREADSYTVSISGGLERFHLDGQRPEIKKRLASIEQWGDTRWTTMNGAFSGARNMVYNATDTPDLSGVTDMSRMFRYTTAFNGDLSSWDVSAVTDMSGMFAFTSVFNQPLNDWDVSSVTGMSGMFAFTSVFNQPLNDWDVSSVTTMNSMFADATSFNQPLNAWNVSKVTDMSFMFGDATSFNGNLSSWDVSSVTTMSSMFRDATSFDQPLNAWDVSSVTNMFSMFRSASSFNQTISSWDVSSVTDMNDMFYYATSFNQPLNGWDVSKVTDMSFMFFGASSFNQTISSWDVSAVTDMSGMFAFTSVFNQPLNDWDVSSVTGMSSMFAFTSVFNQPLNDWDVSSVTDMNGMFHFASSFNQPLNDWDVSSVTNMADMFSFATSFDQNLGNWYVTLDPDTIAGTGIPGVVGTISAQNQPLKNHSPTYVIVDGLDKNHFEIVPGNQLNMTSGVPGKAEYSVNVTASGGSVFESGNNWRLLEIKVTGQITDTTPPVIKLEGSSLVTITVDETYTEQGATCEDDVDADKPATVGGDTVDTSTVGQYTVTYDCTDSSNNEATQVSRTVNVQSAPDTDAPVIIITGSANIQLTVDETYTEQGATCDDDVDADKPATVGGDTVDTSTVGQYTVTYDCTDTAGNVATQVLRTVNVQDAPDTTLLADAFITTWRTDSANQTITIPVGGSTARYSIDWGDNSPAETDITGDSTHTYREADSYTVSISGGLERFHLDGQRPEIKKRLASIEQWGDTRWTTMNGAFSGARNMVYNATDTPDLSGVTDMSRMFRYTTAFNGDLSSWDVSAVTDMSGMFAFTSVFNQPLNDWDVSSVTGMSGMFAFTSVFNQPLNDWDVSSVTTMNSMFADATSFNQPLNAWNVSKVTDMSFMFGDATSFNGNLSSWDVSSVTNMLSMFRDATSFDQPLNAWDVSSVTNMFSMFRSASSFNQTISSWDVSSVTDMNDMFYYATSFNQPLNGWDVSKVTDMSFMFFGASSFNQTISSWDVSAVTDMSGMFAFTSVFNQPLNDWDVSSVTGMSSMFAFTSVFNQPLNDWDVSSVTDMNGMFHFASSFNQPLNDWDVSSVTNMADMFSFATSFDQNLGNWYVTLDPDTIAGTGIPGVVGTISAQNQPLKNHSPTYVIVDGLDKNHFEIVPGNQLNMTSGVPGKAEYSVNVTASGGSVFESGNNWRLLEIKVTGQITDTTPPVIKLEGSSLVTITVDETYTEQGATCEDDVDADKPATVGGDTVDTSTVGQYTVTYDCTDSSNNEATQVSRTVNVQSAPDTDAPVIIITGSANIQLTVDETYTEQGATCDDDVDADKPATVGGDTVDTSTVGQYTVTYDCTDTAGNVATQVLRTVNVQDST